MTPGGCGPSERSEAALEVTFVAQVLAHIDRRVREFDRRLSMLETERLEADAGAIADVRTAAQGLHLEIRRVRAAASLLALHLQVRREHVSRLREARPDSTSTTKEQL